MYAASGELSASETVATDAEEAASREDLAESSSLISWAFLEAVY